MENNARWKVALVITVQIVLTFGCTTIKHQVAKEDSQTNKVIMDHEMVKINQSLSALENLGCGSPNLNSTDLCAFNLNNMTFLKCVRGNVNNRDIYSKVMSEITKELEFDNRCFVRYIWHIEDLDDSLSFATAIDLLRNEWHPDLISDDTYSPLCEYVNDRLIIPHIKAIDGQPWRDYFEKDQMRYLFNQKYIDHMNYYWQMKDLWESGRITLTSQE